MKLIIRDYLASLREREELDAILPDLLSGLGFTVYSRPRRGTTQHGVDVAAVGRDDDGQRKVFLFSVKQGDLTRQDCDGTAQGLRASLNEIMDVYIPTRIPQRYRALKVVVCLCFGGDVQEQVRAAVTGFTSQTTTDRVSFDEWNGDKLAGLLLQGILREEVLPKEQRASFQKAVAMVDEPDAAYRHFADLIRQLRAEPELTARVRVRIARQIYVCLWIFFVWARDVSNVEGPYRASELALLNVWDLLRPFIDKTNRDSKAIVAVFNHLTQLHLIIAGELIERKVLPHVGKRHALSAAVDSRSPIDVNLKMFDLLGRIAMVGLWLQWAIQRNGQSTVPSRSAEDLGQKGFALIQNNPTLFCPIMDQSAIDIALFLTFCATLPGTRRDVVAWLREMAERVDLTLRTHGKYPCIFTEYRDLAGHPREQSEAYRTEATAGSILIPLVAAWLSALGEDDALRSLIELKSAVLEHCTLQLWLPDAASEDKIYTGARDHGVALSDLPIVPVDSSVLLDTVADACAREPGFEALSACTTGNWPIVLLACRHHRFPVPPQFWVNALRPPEGGAS